MDNVNDVNNKENLEKELDGIFLSLSAEDDTGVRRDLIDEIGNLYKLKNEADKLENEKAAREAEREMEARKFKEEQDLKVQELELKKKDGFWNKVLEVVKVVIPAGVTLLGTKAWVDMSREVMDFEQTGTIRSKAMPSVGSFGPKKK